MCFAKQLILLLVVILLSGCGDNLIPSGEDKRPVGQPGTIGAAVGQNAPDFSVTSSTGTVVTLATALAAKKGVVLYFTMWCPICDSHMSRMRDNIIPQFPDVGFYAVDYVAASIADARSSELANGYGGSGFTTLADYLHILTQGYQGTMGTTVVIDRSGVIRMNEDFRDGTRLTSILAGLQ
jgi:peroxiredoxin